MQCLRSCQPCHACLFVMGARYKLIITYRMKAGGRGKVMATHIWHMVRFSLVGKGVQMPKSSQCPVLPMPASSSSPGKGSEEAGEETFRARSMRLSPPTKDQLRGLPASLPISTQVGRTEKQAAEAVSCTAANLSNPECPKMHCETKFIYYYLLSHMPAWDNGTHQPILLQKA